MVGDRLRPGTQGEVSENLTKVSALFRSLNMHDGFDGEARVAFVRVTAPLSALPWSIPGGCPPASHAAAPRETPESR